MSHLAIITGLFVGRVENRWPGKPPSAIGKHLVDGPLKLGEAGFEEDSQADLTVHGGKDKALHHYAVEHYNLWKSEFPAYSERFKPGGFGENISTIGVTERDLCIGDILKLGPTLVQVSQGRQPCWKLNAHTGNDKMAYRFKKTGRTGWYYRVLQGGEVRVGDKIELVERLHPQWPLDKVIAAMFNPAIASAVTAELGALSSLADEWRKAFDAKSG